MHRHDREVDQLGRHPDHPQRLEVHPPVEGGGGRLVAGRGPWLGWDRWKEVGLDAGRGPWFWWATCGIREARWMRERTPVLCKNGVWLREARGRSPVLEGQGAGRQQLPNHPLRRDVTPKAQLVCTNMCE